MASMPFVCPFHFFDFALQMTGSRQPILFYFLHSRYHSNSILF